MFLKKLSLPFMLIAFSLVMIQCTTSSTPDDVPTIEVENTDLMGLENSYTTTVVAKFQQGVPTTTLSQEEFQAMFQQVAQTTQELDGSLINYYVEAKDGGPKGQDYFLILNGELSDGSYLKSGFLLTPTGGGMTIVSSLRGRPVAHFSCRGTVCNNCVYVYSLNGRIDCGCSWGVNDCYKYYPDQDPT